MTTPNIEETNTREIEEFATQLSKSVRYSSGRGQYDAFPDCQDAYLDGVETAIAMMYIDLTGSPKSQGMLARFLHHQLQKARQDIHTSLVTAVEWIEEYMEAKDNSSHRYEIPRSKKKEWEAFCDIPEDDERSWDVPEWANRIDGMPVRSIKEQVLTIINSIFKE